MKRLRKLVIALALLNLALALGCGDLLAGNRCCGRAVRRPYRQQCARRCRRAICCQTPACAVVQPATPHPVGPTPPEETHPAPAPPPMSNEGPVKPPLE